MDVNQKKSELRKHIEILKQDIEKLNKNIIEFENILDSIKTEEDFKRYDDFDIEDGLILIEIY